MYSKLAGNEHIKQTLRRLVNASRVPNSLLFAGDDGIGKRQFAIELARSLICVDKVDGEACGVCSSCRRIRSFEHPTSEKSDDYDQVFFTEHLDVGFALPIKRNLRIGAIRALEREANFHPFEASARVFIVDDADKMAGPASNALLKTLEEPAPTTHIFLISSRPDSLLPTIRSRCQTLRFAPVAADEIERFLIAEHAFTHDEARLAARLSRGSIGRAVSINVQEYQERRHDMLDVLHAAIETCEIAPMLRISEKINDAKHKVSFEDHLDILQSLVHDIWTVKTAGEISRITNSDLSDEITRLASAAGGKRLDAWLQEIDELRDHLSVNINRRVGTDALFVSMAGT